MPNEVKLLPCPFCGSKRAIPERVLASEWLVMCDKCEATGPSGASKDQAIAAWNHRPTTVVTDEEVVERVARALCEANFARNGCEGEFGTVDDCWFAFVDDARSAIAAMVTK